MRRRLEPRKSMRPTNVCDRIPGTLYNVMVGIYYNIYARGPVASGSDDE